MENVLTIDSTDSEIMAEFESLRAQACGWEIGEKDQTPREAAEAEGWTVVRVIYASTNVPGTPVLAQDLAENLFVVNDLDGPWAIEVAEAPAQSVPSPTSASTE
jgi:hypothetical protein